VLSRVREWRRLMPRLGVRKLHNLLLRSEDESLRIGRDYLIELLREHQLLVMVKRRYCVTSLSDQSFRVYPNLLPQTTISRPNQVWVSDITYLSTCRGFCYLFLVTDYYSRRIVGYHLADNLSGAGACLAFKMAARNTCLPTGLIHHSDHGLQYYSKDFRKLLTDHKAAISMTGKNHCYDNAVAERVNGILKHEFGLANILADISSARFMVRDAINIYNSRRPHLALNYKTPDEVYAA
jgi:putative transposase